MVDINVFSSGPISCHSFSADKSRMAVSHNNSEVVIYHRENGQVWSQEHVLTEHDLRVTSIDWAPKTNKIVTCSADRNAYVWSYIDNTWKPTSVLIRVDRANTVVRWSPEEDKFAVGSGAKSISVCNYDKQNDWWLCKQIKRHIRSTITSIDWHPNNLIFACGSTGYKVRIFCADFSQKSESEKTVWSDKPLKFGDLLHDFSSKAWVYDVAFSPDGTKLAWVSHDSTVSVVDPKKINDVFVFRSSGLPHLSIVWPSSECIVAAGHDCCPMLYKYNSSTGVLEFLKRIDKSTKKEVDGFSAMRKFHVLDKFAISLNDNNSIDNIGETNQETIHQNSIREIRMLSNSSGKVTRISTVGLDGKAVIWDISQFI